MRTLFPSLWQAAALALAIMTTLSACGGGSGSAVGVPPGLQEKTGMTLAEVSGSCTAQPGATCDDIRVTVRLADGVSDARPQPQEKPASGTALVLQAADRQKQADGSWRLTFKTVPGLLPGEYTGKIELSLPATVGLYKTESMDYKVIVAPLAGSMGALQALPGVDDWEGVNGNAAHTGLVPATFDSRRFTRRWTWLGASSPRAVVGSPVVTANGLVYVSQQSAAPAEGSSKYVTTSTVTALSESDSQARWTQSLTSDGYLGAPAVSGGKLAMAGSDTVYVFDALAGGVPLGVRPPNTNGALLGVSLATAPTFLDGNVYLGGNNDVSAIGAATGQTRWSASLGLSKLGNVDEWTPAVNASTVYSHAAGALTAFNIADGTTRFSVAVPGQVLGGLNKSSLRQAPVLAEAGSVLVLNQRPLAGEAADNSLSLVDVDSRAVRWTVQGQFSTQPVVARGVVYVGNQAGQALEARQLADGALLWRWPLDTALDGYFGGDLIVTGNLLFVGGRNNTYAIDLASRKTVWTYRMGGSLALSRHGVLYIRQGTDLPGSSMVLTAINLQ
ncbi:PQQ-binding-like beta-propeller repeat protein [Janthinobacterium sp. FW305-128]|uniref:outer membrane protein assembly factor BamB family protein n=1 Tax=Janthinobacterium sp. FW305-128 TaxID=2775055 RepID=UPI001E365013|nr:PQQ-binding-like beta-propeller repeat protein [Janthinobacterium sp. FW305-128]MCC7681365.1 PQQ-binding-like beta-propeller repeat protein [Janthinobacterium sp. FW305-128]